MVVHLIKASGKYACGVGGKRWASANISGTRGIKKVTCKSCLKAAKVAK